MSDKNMIIPEWLNRKRNTAPGNGERNTVIKCGTTPERIEKRKTTKLLTPGSGLREEPGKAMPERKKIIFLDFDGVMDTAYYDIILTSKGLPGCDEYGVVFDPECVRNLRTIIDATGADIVVTSTWKSLMSHNEILNMWKGRHLPGFVTGVTPDTSMHRGDEIDAWLRECNTACEYVIIDDLDASNFNGHQINHLITVSPYNGLDELAAERAVSMLHG